MAREAPEDRNAMSFPELLAWGWRITSPTHENATNLLIHLFAVPLFVIGNALLVLGIISYPWLLLAAPLCIVVSLTLQKFGHSRERNEVPPFTSPGDFLRRLYAEQFFNFWRFLLSGQWHANFKARSENT